MVLQLHAQLEVTEALITDIKGEAYRVIPDGDCGAAVSRIVDLLDAA